MISKVNFTNEDNVLAAIDGMPTLSPTVSKILELTNDINSSPQELMQVIKMDPLLTAKVLKVVNSSYFSLVDKISSLNRALVYLGLNTIKNLALSTAVVDAFKGSSPEANAEIGIVWEHSLACAVAGKMLAKELGVSRLEHEDYFLAGLLHDIGKVFLIQSDYDFYQEIKCGAIEENCSFIEKENMMLGTNHAILGGIISKKWNFPEFLCLTIECHHDPLSAEIYSKKAGTVYIANYMSYALGITENEDPMPPEVTEELWNLVGLTEEKTQEYLITLPEEIEKAKVFLKPG